MNLVENHPATQPHSVRFWKIEEAVGGGYYIVLPGSWSHKTQAEKNFPKGSQSRAVEYQQGRGNEGAVRV